MARARQQLLPISHVRNRGLFSNHWFENRLPLEPEWNGLRDNARTALEILAGLWEQERGRVERYGTEGQLEHAFIQPIFEALGWRLLYQTFLEGRRPDYALFLDDDALDAALAVERNSPEFWRSATLVADAKAWHILLNRPTYVNNQREYPPQQIEWYLDRSRRDFGVLTNGGLWRLVPRDHSPHQRRFQTYLECDLAGLLNDWRSARLSRRQGQRVITEREALVDEFLQFFLFFSPAAYRATDRLKPLIQRAIEGSSEYRVGVGEGLKERAFDALKLCIEGFLTYPPNDLDPHLDLQRCKQESFILLYRLLFIMYAEDRRLLPYRVNRTYTDNRSLGRHRDEIAGRLDRIHDHEEEDYSHDTTDIWEDLQSLFDLVDAGHRRYGVPEYNGGLFDADEHTFLGDKKISDYYMARVIDQLGRAQDRTHPAAGLFRVDYRDLAIQHLGSIYEGLLELQPTYALTNTVVISGRIQGRLVEKYLPEADPVPRGWQLTEQRYRQGTIYLRTEKGERRASGSYYTPDHIVSYIVDRTIDPLCQAISERLQTEIDDQQAQLERAPGADRPEVEARLEALRADFDDRVLQLRVLDPAMGSGHFLIRACQRLAEEIATHPYTGDDTAAGMLEGESAVSYWKRRVVESCLYGVDLNDLAVELAKLALWLETVAGDEPLSFLNHHLRYGNSLVGGIVAEMGVLHGEIELRAENYREQVERAMPALLEKIVQIGEIASDTKENIKAKERLYREFERSREPYRLVGDLYCSAFCSDSPVTSDLYQTAVDELGRPRRFARLTREEWFRQALAVASNEFTRCFHWELEFPEVFFDGSSRRDNAGFDAVIGNPPYDVLSELETGHKLESLKAFIRANAFYDPSRRGKNNLYKLFICRALDLVRNGGHFGFITPMAVLGDDQAADIRRKIVELGWFTGIEAFPQKDNPAQRVFPEAKLSTAVFTIEKSELVDRERTFVSRVHPADTIDVDSPSLSLSTASIPAYDPSNFTIVSCDQEDWDLATRIMRSGRLGRLRSFCESFQGEVNETNEGKRNALSSIAAEGPLVLRGANLCLYAVREASQGERLYLLKDTFFDGKSRNSKAYHSLQARAGFQRSSPQNNFRRIVAAMIDADSFCFDTVSYVPESESSLPLEFIVGLLNSKLVDWYFRLGSTNSKVNEYQFNNLPCPIFAGDNRSEEAVGEPVLAIVETGDLEKLLAAIEPAIEERPFGREALYAVVHLVKSVGRIEHDRGEIRRAARSALAPAAQPYQDAIDQILYRMAGLADTEIARLEERLAAML